MIQLPPLTVKVALLVLATGCLPRGAAPVGQQLLTTRAATGAELLPLRQDQPPRMVTWQPRADGHGDDLYVAELSPTGAGPARLLAERVDLQASTGTCDDGDCGLAVDGRGRILLRAGGYRQEPSGPLSPSRLVRVDLASGTREDLGEVNGFEHSATGDRLLLPTERGGTYRVLDLDGGETVVERAFNHHLVGDTLFYLSDPPDPPAGDGSEPRPDVLYVFGPDRTTTQIAEPVRRFSLHRTGGRPVFLLERPASMGRETAYALLDPFTLQETPLGSLPRTSVDLSPDGRGAVLVTEPVDSRSSVRQFRFIDRQTGASESFGLDAPSSWKAIPVYWRPGHAEAWIISHDHAFLWRAGAGVSKIESLPALFPMLNPDVASPFTDDGAHCLLHDPSSANFGDELAPVFVADADHPDGPRLLLNPAGSGLKEVAVIDEAHLLISTFTTEPNQRDLQVFDTRTGDTRPVATGGWALAADSQRALAMLRVSLEQPWSGDLTLIDVASGAHSLLGESVLSSMLHPGARAPLGSGARVLFRVRSTLPSPYDGLWMATLP
jgi:hypothetical protein